MAELTLTEKNFGNLVLKSDKPVLVDFWATWCGPCRMLAPIVAEIAGENEGKVVVGKVNVDDEPALAEKYGIASIPTVLLFRNGKPVSASIGYRPKEELMKILD